MITPADGDECYTDFALQEYIAGRLDLSVRGELEAHLTACGGCRDALQAFQLEATLLQGALSRQTGTDKFDEYSDELLSLYLSGALDPVGLSALENALSRQPALLARLIMLSREVASVQHEARSGTPKTAADPPEGVVLRMPRRTSPPTTISVQGLRHGGLGA